MHDRLSRSVIYVVVVPIIKDTTDKINISDNYRPITLTYMCIVLLFWKKSRWADI